MSITELGQERLDAMTLMDNRLQEHDLDFVLPEQPPVWESVADPEGMENMNSAPILIPEPHHSVILFSILVICISLFVRRLRQRV